MVENAVRKGLIRRIWPLTPIAPQNLVAPNYEMRTTPAIAPDRWIYSEVAVTTIQSPCLAGPAVKIDRQHIATPVRTGHNQRPLNAASIDDDISGFF
ncbi:hypothetical protein AU467_16745 [Mesorhizobium loti]|uniref:Uncharacterized protein n=1 Tax=Rhizobium loti TaxID=381 RepID=A0A124GGR2_RHILI|nr:hypothetical protein AU467_16745 [Mesorhizobium loti]